MGYGGSRQSDATARVRLWGRPGLIGNTPLAGYQAERVRAKVMAGSTSLEHLDVSNKVG